MLKSAKPCGAASAVVDVPVLLLPCPPQRWFVCGIMSSSCHGYAAGSAKKTSSRQLRRTSAECFFEGPSQ